MIADVYQTPVTLRELENLSMRRQTPPPPLLDAVGAARQPVFSTNRVDEKPEALTAPSVSRI